MSNSTIMIFHNNGLTMLEKTVT